MSRMRQMARHEARASSEQGSSFVETLVALTLLLIVMSGLMSMDAVATTMTENYGQLSARITEYAADKLEQVLALGYGDTTSDTTVSPTSPTGGTGLAIGGSSNVATPVTGYVDYLDQNGQLLVIIGGAPPAGWYYKRVWQIASPSTNLKQITVSVTVARGVGRAQPSPVTVAALKTFPF